MSLRIVLSLLALTAWMMLLFTGWAFAGAVHLLVIVALALFPWRSLPRRAP